ncbi:cytochrome c oxidase assembly factor 6 homolog isoform X1 [Engystomops pustulosus]|uniref:cytochrome c oxidase assembly factor 6 homolog isoform X1 n=2 Tax=Engystomops pustulosus TaxID=76066 RepID=UPI003AFA456F
MEIVHRVDLLLISASGPSLMRKYSLFCAKNGQVTIHPSYTYSSIMTAPTAKERKACWDSRDKYWQCLEDNKEDVAKCQQLRQSFESLCPRQWTKYFDKRRDYLKFKEEMENKGFEPAKPSEKT